jgi:hypothetical protein
MCVGKDKFVLVLAMKAYEVAELHLRPLLTTVINRVSDKLHALAALIMDNNLLPHTQFLGFGIGHRAGVDNFNNLARFKAVAAVLFRLMFCWPCTIVDRYSETNVMQYLFSLLRIKGLYMFQVLLARPQ